MFDPVIIIFDVQRVQTISTYSSWSIQCSLVKCMMTVAGSGNINSWRDGTVLWDFEKAGALDIQNF